MNDEQAKEFINQQEPTFLDRAPKNDSHHRPTYICPKCHNGDGQNGTGMEYSDRGGPHYVCYKCGHGGDVITLWRDKHPGESFPETMQHLADYYHIDLDRPQFRKGKNVKGRELEWDDTIRDGDDSAQQPTTQPQEQQPQDLTGYFKECQARAKGNSYLAARGISQDTIDHFWIGIDPQFRRGTGGKTWEAVIIPTSPWTFNARNTDPSAPKGQRYRKTKGSSARMFNAKALTTAELPIFITEGEFDALSFYESGAEGVALGGAGSYTKLVEAVKVAKPVQPLVIALDNDDTGIRDANALAKELDALDVPYYMATDEKGSYDPTELYGKYKDANERLQQDREGFHQAVLQTIENVFRAQEADDADDREKYQQQSAGAHLQDFLDGVKASASTPPTPTGFERLDRILDDGLYEGLYIVGGLSSLGKTSLVMQIADQIAAQGRDVLIFSLEMARSELMAKTISRYTLIETLAHNGDMRDAKTGRGITAGNRYAGYSKKELNLIKKAVMDYKKFAAHIYITESIGALTVKDIKDEVNRYISVMGAKPVVVVDYLQILAPMDPRATDKANMDTTVRELKHISRDNKIPVVCISSYNRASYKMAATMEAFKESGAIEYSSDVLIGLQLKGTGTADFDVDAAKRQNPREVEAVILKNRNGKTGVKTNFKYYPAFSYFTED